MEKQNWENYIDLLQKSSERIAQVHIDGHTNAVLNTLYLNFHGSHLYGTETEQSDLDLKGVCVSPISNLITRNAPKTYKFSSGGDNSQNSQDDIDIEFIELHKFLNDVYNCQPYALEMLFGAKQGHLFNTVKFEEIVTNYEDYLSYDLSPFFGYTESMIHKYSMKGERLDAIQTVINLIEKLGRDKIKELRVQSIVTQFKEGEKYINRVENENGDMLLEVAGKQYDYKAPLEKMYQSLKKSESKYGDRVRNKDGVDYKAMSHALRLVNELKQMLKHGRLYLPLEQAYFIKDVKLGKIDYEDVYSEIEALYKECKTLDDQSNKSSKGGLPKLHQDFLIDWYVEKYDIDPYELQLV